MSSDPQLPSDDEIDAFVRGDDALSKAYRAARYEQPSRDIDDAVLAFAQQAVRPRRSLRRRWQAPMALAAALVLGLGLVLNLWREPEVRAPAPAKPSAVLAQEPVAESAVVDESAVENEALAQKKIAQEAARHRAEQRMQHEQMQREAERVESATARAQRRAQMARETTQRNVMQDAAPADVEALPPAPPPPAAAPASPTMSVAPRAAFAPPPTPRAAPLAQAEAEYESFPAQALSAAPSPQEKKALASPSWKPARFADLELGIATRADVIARYGEPESQGISESSDAAADAPRLHYDAYPNLPGIDGITEFYYEPISQRLLGVRVVLRKPMPAQRVVDQLGWSEPAQARDWSHPPCESERESEGAFETKSGAESKTETSHYGVYPQRGAYLFQPAGLVEQIVYEADCS